MRNEAVSAQVRAREYRNVAWKGILSVDEGSVRAAEGPGVTRRLRVWG